jgi:hypothetical protein
MAGVDTGGAVRVQMPTSAKVGDRFARMGVTQNTYVDERDLYGQGKRSSKKMRWAVTGNTGGEGGHDEYGWVPYEEEMEYTGNSAEGS